MVVREYRNEASRPEAAGLDSVFLSALVLHWSVLEDAFHFERTYIAQRELGEISLQIVVASDYAILSNNK